MGLEDEKNRGFVVGHHHESYPPPTEPPPPPPPHASPPPPPQPYYGTFQGIPTYPPSVGFPQPAAPPAPADPHYYTHNYQSVPGYAVAEGQPMRERHLPCCGIGLGWCLFILGFFFAGIPWYVGAILLICSRGNFHHRDKPGYVLCTIAAFLVTVALILGAIRGDDDW